MPATAQENTEPDQQKAKHYLKIAEKVRTGEYFREARSMYDITIHDPMAERYMYVFITAVAVGILLTALVAVQGLYPLQSAVPLIYVTHNFYEDMPQVKPLQLYKNEDPSEALLRFLAKNYVIVREEYDIATFDRDVNSVKSQSSDEVFKEFQKFIDPYNPESPIKVYQRHSKRRITVLRTRRLPGGMEIIFEAAVDSRTEIKRSHWRANMSFQYSGIELDEKTDKVKPMSFVVTEYKSKRLQDMTR